MQPPSHLLRLSVASVFALAACGGGQPIAQTADDFEPATDSEIRSGGDNIQVQGVLGTIPARKIDRRLQGRLSRMSRCFMRGMEEVEQVGGNIELSFRVDAGGGVEWVHVRKSDIGHRGVERCILEQAASVRFPEPRGGDGAEFTWGFGLEPAGDIRPPVPWPESRVQPAVAAAEGLAACAGDHTVTAYVAPGGAVLAVGVASDDNDAARSADCVADAVRGLSMPDPGSYPAKVSFRVR